MNYLFFQPHAGYTVEEGANWIHGVEKNNNPLLTLANSCQVKYYNTTSTDTIAARNSNGTCANHVALKRIYVLSTV